MSSGEQMTQRGLLRQLADLAPGSPEAQGQAMGAEHAQESRWEVAQTLGEAALAESAASLSLPAGDN